VTAIIQRVLLTEDIEALIETLQETHKKEKEELQAKLNRLERNKERLVEEETKTLKAERDALSREVTRLKVFDIEDKDITWSLQRMEEIRKAADDFDTLCRMFIFDDRLDDDLHNQALVEGVIKEVKMLIMTLEQDWIERFYDYDD